MNDDLIQLEVLKERNIHLNRRLDELQEYGAMMTMATVIACAVIIGMLLFHIYCLTQQTQSQCEHIHDKK